MAHEKFRRQTPRTAVSLAAPEQRSKVSTVYLQCEWKVLRLFREGARLFLPPAKVWIGANSFAEMWRRLLRPLVDEAQPPTSRLAYRRMYGRQEPGSPFARIRQQSFEWTFVYLGRVLNFWIEPGFG